MIGGMRMDLVKSRYESYDELYWSDDESDFESDDGEGG